MFTLDQRKTFSSICLRNQFLGNFLPALENILKLSESKQKMRSSAQRHIGIQSSQSNIFKLSEDKTISEQFEEVTRLSVKLSVVFRLKRQTDVKKY